MRCALIFSFVILTSSLVSAETSVVPAERTYDIVCSRKVSHVIAPAGIRGRARAPRPAVLDTDIRPGRSRLYLDGRLVGMATDFNGSPDFMYLEPGRYRLEARLGGYQSAAFEIEAAQGRPVRIVGLTLRNADMGIDALTPLALSDIRIENVATVGVLLRSGSHRIDRVEVNASGGTIGVLVNAHASVAIDRLRVTGAITWVLFLVFSSISAKKDCAARAAATP